jgi:GNAT superfamily N-acetyltransferase
MNGLARRAGDSDLAHILELDRVDPVGHPRIELLTDRVHSGEVIVFEGGHQLLGFVVARRRAFFGRDFVELLSVSSGARRQGIGGTLLNEAVGQSSSDRIFTSTNESNAAMRALLAKEGWHMSGHLEGIDEGDPEMVYFMDAR